MLCKIKNNFIFFVVGIIAGFLLVAVAGFSVYKSRQAKRVPKRYGTELSAAKNELPQIFIAASLDKVFKDGKTLVKPTFSESAKLSLAKNEYESFQVVIKAGRENLSGVWLDISELTDEKSGAKIDKTNILWRIVGYVPTQKPYYPVKYVGLWPDPLMPAQKTEISSMTVQPFWVTLYTPGDTPAGIYQGTIKVMTDEKIIRQMPFAVEVYNFTLPKESHLKTAFDFYNHVTKDRYPQGEREDSEAHKARISALNEKFTIEMLKYRMNPILNIDPMSQGDLGRVDRYRVYGLNNFSIGKKGGTFSNNWPSSDEEIEKLFGLYRTYGETLKLNKMLHYTYIYTWDEGKIGNPRVAKICSMIHRAYPGLKNMVCYHGFWDPDTDPAWGKDIDIWCFQVDEFVESQMRKLQKIGKEVWMYISGPGGSGTPNLAIDFDGMDYRIVPWLCFKYDIKGFLYWSVNWWPLVDPFKSAANTKWEQNGNGLLFYPGQDGPIASLRCEIFRDGMEDYEYIQLLLSKIRDIKRYKLDMGNEGMIDEAIKLMTVDSSIAVFMDNFTKDSAVLLARRHAIAKKIEEVNRFLAIHQSFMKVPEKQ